MFFEQFYKIVNAWGWVEKFIGWKIHMMMSYLLMVTNGIQLLQQYGISILNLRRTVEKNWFSHISSEYLGQPVNFSANSHISFRVMILLFFLFCVIKWIVLSLISKLQRYIMEFLWDLMTYLLFSIFSDPRKTDKLTNNRKRGKLINFSFLLCFALVLWWDGWCFRNLKRETISQICMDRRSLFFSFKTREKKETTEGKIKITKINK